MSKQVAYLVGILLLGILYLTGFQISKVFDFRQECHLLPPPQDHSTRIQLALLLDTSSSMDGLIEQAKSQLWKMVNELARAKKHGAMPQIEIALYEYGNSELSASSGFIRQLTPFTTDIDQVSELLYSLTTGGGEEYCGKVLEVAAEQLHWTNQPNDLKVIVIAGNEPFYQGPVSYMEICPSLRSRHILLNTIHCGSYQEGTQTGWKEAAVLAGGQFLNINQDEQVVHIPTPYDREIFELNKQLNLTYINYGEKGKLSQARQRKQDDHANLYSSANGRKRAFFKSNKAYRNSSWDLVDAVSEDEEILKKIEHKALPKNMQQMDLRSRKLYLRQQTAKRKDIQQQINRMKAKVDAFISQHKVTQLESNNTIDQVLLKTVNEQAEAQGFSFE